MLILSGSLGYTLIRHTCMHCGTDEVVATIAGNLDENRCCCIHDAVASHRHHTAGIQPVTDGCCVNDAVSLHHKHSTGELAISDDCCSHEAERVVTGELVRSEVQNEIIPYFLAATIIAVIQDQSRESTLFSYHDHFFNHGRDLTRLHCQIIS